MNSRPKWRLDQMSIGPNGYQKNGYWAKFVLDQLGIGPNGYQTKCA